MNKHMLKRAAVLTVGIIGTLAGHATSQASDAPPYGGCDESWQAVKSDGADWCRAHGWTIRNRVFINPHGVSGEVILPACRYEDGSGQADNCVWFGGEYGNGRGVSYWINQGAREAGKPTGQWLHYFWTADPRVAAGDRWVSADEDSELDSRYSPKDWNDCYVTASVVRADIRCADGTRVASR